MAIPTLPEILEAGRQRGISPDKIAAGVRLWQQDMTELGRGRYAASDPESYWKIAQGVSDDANAALSGLGSLAADREAARLFPDPVERAQFRSVVESSGGDPDRMDAPPAWQEAARRVADASGLPVFKPGGVQYGTIAQGPNPLAVYEVRSKPEGGYEAYVQPQREDGKPGKPVIVPLTGDRAAFTADAEARLAKADQEYNMSVPDAETMGFGGGGGGPVFGMGPVPGVVDIFQQKVDNAEARMKLATKGSLSQVLHVQLDDQLRNNKAFLSQLPKNWGEQFVARPLVGLARSLAQGTAALTSLGAESLTQEGQEAMDVQIPGWLANRYASGEDMPVADLISQGIESFATFIGPALLARGGAAALGAAGRAAAAAGRVAEVGSNAAWGTMFTSSFGANLAGSLQEAERLQTTDPAKADRIRGLSYWTSLMNAGIEMASEKIFPDEARLMAGQRMPWSSIATIPLKEMVEEYTGAVAQNMVADWSGQAQQDPLQAAKGGLFGGLPFMGGHAAMRAMPSRTVPAPAPGPLASGPDASLFPGGAPAAEPAMEQPPAFDPLPPEGDGSATGAGAPLVGAPPPAAAVASPAELAAAGGGPAQSPPLTPATAQDPTGTVPETPETLAEQRRRVVSGQRPAMLFPGVAADQVPREFLPGQDEGLILTETPAGTFLHPFDISSAEIQQAVADGRTGHLLGMGTDAKPQDATDALVQRTADGTEVTAAAVIPETFDSTLAALSGSASPGDTVSLETPEEVLARRVDPAAAPPVSGFPASSEQEKHDTPPPPATPGNVEGDAINRNWTAFAPESGTLGIPRAEMPQIKAEHRGALVNFLNARGVAHERQEVRPNTLKPTQAEYSPGKVAKARGYEGTPRAILVSADNHVVDGHHQWVAALDNPEQAIPVMRLNAPIRDLIPLVNEFPSSEQSGGGASRAAEAPRAKLPKGVKRTASLPERLLPEYFAPGNIVPGYGGMDKVLEFVPQGEGEPVWRVRVKRQIREADGTFRDDPHVPERWHSTHPTYGDVADAGRGVVQNGEEFLREESPDIAHILRPAYDRLVRRGGSDSVFISDLQHEAGVSMEQLHKWIHDYGVAQGQATVDEGDWSVATPEQRAAHVVTRDRRRVYIRLHPGVGTSPPSATPAATASKPIDPSTAQAYTVGRGAPADHPSQPALAATVRRAGSDPAFRQPFPLLAGGRGGRTDGTPAGGARISGSGRGLKRAELTPKERQAMEGLRFRDLMQGRAADFTQGPRITSVMVDMVDGTVPVWDIRGKTLETPADFALLLQPLRTPLFESLKVAVLDADNQVIHAQVVTVGTLAAATASPRDILRVVEASRAGGAKPVSVMISHNHPSGKVDPSGADIAITRKIEEACRLAGVTMKDHVITNGSTFYSFAWKAEGDIVSGLAPWETVPANQRPRLLGDDDYTSLVQLLRQDGAGHGHIVFLDTRTSILAAERFAETDGKSIGQRIVAGAITMGSDKVALDLGHLTGGDLAAARIAIRDALSLTGVELMDIADSTVDSYRANLMLEGEQDETFTLREEADPEPALLPGGPVPPVPDGPVNVFGQRVEADARLRGAWRAKFRPAEYSPFTEEQLSRDIRSWIGREGGLEGAARLFLDPESGLLDYERNALGQQLAIGLDQRARRSERAGNAAATATAEALLDTVIQRLEQYATQAGQALRSFGMWSRFSPRGIVRAVQRRTAAARETHVQETLDTTPDAVIDAVNLAAARAETEEREERKKRGDGAAQRWIERLARSQSDTLSWGSPATLSELEKLIRAHMETVNPAFARQAEALGVPTYDADVLDRLVLEEHRRSANIAREKALERLVERLTKPKAERGVKAKIPPLVQALLDAKAAGVLDRSAFLDAYSMAFKLPRFTPEFAAQVRTLAERAESAPQGSWLRQMAQQALMTRLALWEGIPARDVLTAFWYANILSGIGTQLVNISGNATHLLMKTAQVALTNSPARTIQFVRGMIRGAAEGTQQGREAFVNGWPVMKGETEWQRQSVLEMMWEDNPDKLRWRIAKYGAASWGRYVFRALTAADSLFYNTAKEGRAWLEASRALDRGQTLQEALGFDASSWSAAQAMAHADLQQAGVSTPTTRQVDRRAFEIVEGKRRADVIATARRFGAEATFNYDPEGTMGAFAEVAGLLVRRVPPMRAVIPFVNIVANVADQSMDWTPVGIVRGALGRHIFNSQDQKFTGRQRVEKIVSGTIATLGAAALYALAKMNEDKDDLTVPFMIYGMGPTDKGRRDQMPRGWKPFSIKIGDTYISYAETPLGMLLSTVGTAMDRRRYTGKKNSDEVMERGFALLTGAGQSLMRTGVLSSMDKLFGMLDGTAKPGQVLYRTAAGLIPAQAFLRSIAEAMDPTKVDTSTFTGTLLSNLPVARSYGQPILNVFGENVREPGPWLISRIATRQDRSDAEATWLAAKGLHIPSVADELAVADYLPSQRSEAIRIARQNGHSPLEADRMSRAGDLERLASGYLTPDERTKLIRLSGPRIRNAVRQLQRELATGSYQPKNPAALQRRLSEKVTSARQLSRLEMVK